MDLHQLFFKLRNRWPYFLASLALAGSLALLYLQIKAPTYDFRSTLLLGNQSTGSKQAQELLNLLEVKEKGIKIKDEIGLISSAAMVRQALQRLPEFQVSYYVAPDSWINKVAELKVREEPASDVPFRVVPEPGLPQLQGVAVHIEPLADGNFRLRAEAKKAMLANLATGESLREVFDVNIDETVPAGQPLRHPMLNLTIQPVARISPKPGASYSFQLRDLSSLTGDYQGRLLVRTIDQESRIIELDLKGPVPVKERQFLDTLMSVFIAADVRDKNQTGQRSLDFLNGEIAQMNQERQQAAVALSSFRQAHGVVDVGAQSNSSITQLSNLELERSRMLSQRRSYQTLLQHLRTSHDVTALSSMGVNDQVLNSLILQLSDLTSQKAALGVNASELNPMVAVLNQRIRSVKAALEENLTSVIRSTDITLADLNTQLARVKGDMNRMPEEERQLALLKAKADYNDKNYSFLVEKRGEAAIALATNATDKKIVDRASLVGGGPEAPKPMMVGLIAVLAGLLIPTGLVLGLDKANRRIQSKQDLSEVTSIPLLGVIAHGSRKDKQTMLDTPKGPIAESFRSVRVNLQYLSAGLDKKVLGVTSSVPGEGKTFCAVNLAVELAYSGRRVILVETDLRRPTVANYFDLDKSAPGLVSFLTGEEPLERCIQPVREGQLDVLACGTIPANPTQLLESTRMAQLMERLRDEYDYVMVDTPPVGLVSEYFVLLRFLDANIYVVRHNYTERELVGQINELYVNQKIKHVYLVINDMHFDKTYEYRYKRKAYAYYGA
ncbi:hypothetical protein B0919_23705 [Hymenobacter sp. CRA2]|nr:hypothetical protein B0919_23705 [Hymenobacter sp. CRA2]